jgi:hypothetical protein
MDRPTKKEYNPYFQKYIDLVPPGDVLELFRQNTDAAMKLFGNLPPEKHHYRYAAGKWTPKDLLLHIIDTDRVMSYRALVAARGDQQTPLPPVDENLFAENGHADSREMADLLEEFSLVRAATIKLYEHIGDAEGQLLGNGVQHPISARALAYIMIGHAMHHMHVVQERYL